jgi:hypothetical protein
VRAKTPRTEVRYLPSFSGFWYDFFVGDRWELFVGPIAALVRVWVAIRASVPAPPTGTLLSVLIAAVGGASVAGAMRGWTFAGRGTDDASAMLPPDGSRGASRAPGIL